MKMYFDATEKDCQHLLCKPLVSNIPCYTGKGVSKKIGTPLELHAEI